MNYGGIDAGITPKKKWGKWQTQFLWLPKRIEGRWYWMRRIHYRFYIHSWPPEVFGQENYEYQYAFNLFDLMQKDSQ